MNLIEAIGYIGCIFLFISFIPQTYILIKNNSYDNVSYLFLVLIIKTSMIMGTYGLLIEKYPVIIANISVLLNNLIILLCKYQNYKKILISNNLKKNNNNIYNIEIKV